MLKSCVKAVGCFGKSFGKMQKLFTSSTTHALHLTSKVFFVHNFRTASAQFRSSCSHKSNQLNPPYFYIFYPLPTGSTNTTNLIKE